MRFLLSDDEIFQPKRGIRCWGFVQMTTRAAQSITMAVRRAGSRLVSAVEAAIKLKQAYQMEAIKMRLEARL